MRITRTRPARTSPSKTLRTIAQLSEEVAELKRQVLSAEQAQEKGAMTKSHRHACAEDFTVAPAIFHNSRRSLAHR